MLDFGRILRFSMGRRGRLPDPNSARTREAIARAKSLGIAKPNTPAAKVPMPSTIKGRAAAVRFWKTHADGLAQSNRLRPELADSFAMLCSIYADTQDLEQLVAEQGWTVATTINPTARLLLNARRDFVALAKEFGLTAASSQRIPVDTGASDGQENADEAALRAFTG